MPPACADFGQPAGCDKGLPAVLAWGVTLSKYEHKLHAPLFAGVTPMAATPAITAGAALTVVNAAVTTALVTKAAAAAAAAATVTRLLDSVSITTDCTSNSCSAHNIF